MLKKSNVLEFTMLKDAEMDMITGGVQTQSSVGKCDICHSTRSAKATKELVGHPVTGSELKMNVALL